MTMVKNFINYTATESDVLYTEQFLQSIGYSKSSPDGYANYYSKDGHYKAYFRRDGSFWIVEGYNNNNAMYIIEELVR